MQLQIPASLSWASSLDDNGNINIHNAFRPVMSGLRGGQVLPQGLPCGGMHVCGWLLRPFFCFW